MVGPQRIRAPSKGFERPLFSCYKRFLFQAAAAAAAAGRVGSGPRKREPVRVRAGKSGLRLRCQQLPPLFREGFGQGGRLGSSWLRCGAARLQRCPPCAAQRFRSAGPRAARRRRAGAQQAAGEGGEPLQPGEGPEVRGDLQRHQCRCAVLRLRLAWVRLCARCVRSRCLRAERALEPRGIQSLLENERTAN